MAPVAGEEKAISAVSLFLRTSDKTARRTSVDEGATHVTWKVNVARSSSPEINAAMTSVDRPISRNTKLHSSSHEGAEGVGLTCDARFQPLGSDI